MRWNAYGVAMTLLLGLGLGVLAVNRANRPVTRWCRHGAAAGCAKGQGYLFAKPVSLAQLPAAIEAAARFVRDVEPSIAQTPRTTAAA